MEQSEFETYMAMLRSGDSERELEGFQALLSRYWRTNTLNFLLAAWEEEQDYRIRLRLLELIAEAKSASALPLFTDLLTSTDPNLQRWALYGLRAMNMPPARRVLQEARSFTFADQAEADRFRALLDESARWKIRKYACPCCGYLTLKDPPPGTYDVCKVCCWEDDPGQFEDPDTAGEGNRYTLRQAQQNFIAHGYADEKCAGTPETYSGSRDIQVERDPAWKPR